MRTKNVLAFQCCLTLKGNIQYPPIMPGLCIILR